MNEKKKKRENEQKKWRVHRSVDHNISEVL
jgi:hypothetical protein